MPLPIPNLFATISYQGHEYSMRGLTPGDLIYKRWQETEGFYELPLLEAIRGANRQGVYVDVGAHLGNHSVFFACHCPATKVIAVEARPEAAEVLEDNLNRSSRIPFAVKRYAAAAKEGGATLSKLDPDNVGSGIANYCLVGGDVLAYPLDRIVQVKERVAVIKLDIEGGELEALQGAERRLRRDKPLVAVEASTPERQEGVSYFLKGLGYQQRQKFTQGTPTFIWTT